jgi:hypothetical protein
VELSQTEGSKKGPGPTLSTRVIRYRIGVDHNQHLSSHLSSMSSDPAWQAKIIAKRASLAALLPGDIVEKVKRSVAAEPSLVPAARVPRLLSDREKEIVALEPSELVKRTTTLDSAKRLTAVEVAKTYIKTATIAQVLVCFGLRFTSKRIY